MPRMTAARARRILACGRCAGSRASLGYGSAVLRREVARDVQDQLRKRIGEDIGGAVVGRHDRHVGRDEAPS